MSSASGMEGTRIGRYRIESLVGSGGMGAVYRAVDPLLGRIVALKVLSAAHDDATAQERFFREARAIARLEHRNIVRIYEAGAPEGTAYIAMEFLNGIDGRQFVKSAPSLSRSLDVMAQVFDGLACAHGLGVIHRDVKPGNMIVMPGDVVKLIDFGLARLSDDQRDLTRGQIFGSAPFMAPEQITTPGQIDARTDIYSAGVVLYGLATGTLPYKGATVAETLVQIVHAPVPAVESLRPECPQDLAVLVRRCLAKDPAERPSTAIEVAEVLRRISHRISGPRVPPPPPPPVSPITFPIPSADVPEESFPSASQALTQYDLTGAEGEDADAPPPPPTPSSNLSPARPFGLTIAAAGFVLAVAAGLTLWLRKPPDDRQSGTKTEFALPTLPAIGGDGAGKAGEANSPTLVAIDPPAKSSKLHVRGGDNLTFRVRVDGASVLPVEPQWRLNDAFVASGSTWTYTAARGPRLDLVTVSLPGLEPSRRTFVLWYVSVE